MFCDNGFLFFSFMLVSAVALGLSGGSTMMSLAFVVVFGDALMEMM